MLATDPRNFWGVINPKDDDNVTLIDRAENFIPSNLCASILNDVFKHNFSATINVSLPPPQQCGYLVMFPIIIEPTGVESD